jgi:predicted metal-dependent peptidase
MSLSPREKLAAGITRVVDPTRKQNGQPNGVAPYFGAILRGLIRREITEDEAKVMDALGMTPTLAVSADGILRWHPKFVAGLSADELAAVLIHEAMHVALKHAERGAAMGVVPDPTPTPPDGVDLFTRARLWNHAADACINEEIRKFTTLPKINGASCIFHESLKQPAGLPTEERFRRLLEEQKKQPKSGSGGQGAGKGKKSQEGAAAGHCGGCSQRPIPGEPAPGKGKGKDGEAEGRSEAEMERMRRATAEAVKDYSSKNRGLVPDSLERWADELLKPAKVPWRQKLARTVRGAVAYRPGAVDFTWSRVSRRQAGVGWGAGRPIVPATHAPQPRVGVLIDTSGSMGPDALALALSEVHGVLDAVGANVTVAVCDADMHGMKEVRTVKEAAAMLKGGGGTDMTPGMRAFANKKPAPDVLIVMTDGYIDDGYLMPEPQHMKVVWLVIGGNEMPCPYGERVFITADDIREEAA